MANEKTKDLGDLNKYEVMVIFDPELGEDATEKKLQELRDLIGTSKGEIWHEDKWGLRDLAYKIGGCSRGYYSIMNFTLLPSKLKKIDKHLKLEKEVLRSLILKVPDNYEVKTLKEYLVEAEQEEKEKAAEAEKAEEATKRPAPKKKVVAEKPVEKVVEKEEEKEEAPKEKVLESVEPEEIKEEVSVEKLEKKKKEDNKNELDELDKKLQSIINDPDIIL